jgi:hypothetical protein
MMLFCFVVVVVNAILLQIAAEEAVLENSFVSFTFDSSKGFTKLIDKRSGLDAIGTAAGSVSIWEFQLVDIVGELTVELPRNAQFVSTKDEAGKSSMLNMAWNNIDVLRGNTFVANVNVTLNVVLPDVSSVAEWELSLAVNSGDAVGVWDGVVSVPLSIASDPDGELFFPSGFGHTFTEPAASTGGNYASTYPGGMCTMQFIAMGNTKASSGVYMAALDSAGQGKGLQYSTFASSLKPDPSHHVLHGSKGKKMVAPVRRWSASASDGDAALSMTIFPPNAGLPLALGATWTAPYKLAIGVLQDVSSDQGRPLWAEAAQQYRQWALQHADWTRPGTLAEREEKKLKQEAALSKNVPVPPMPAWYRTNTLWLNTHWQCHDIFNATGGDPHFVLPYTLEVAEHLWGSDPATPRSMALHWYEWQQGPDPAPEARYLFDTHYPDYFPSRTDFKSAVQELRKRGIQSFPYINGRISDVNSISYAADNGALYCSKAAPARLVLPDSQQELTPYVETYGSNATFCVTNPFTPYWQQKLADTVKELVDDYGCPGVYIGRSDVAVLLTSFHSLRTLLLYRPNRFSHPQAVLGRHARTHPGRRELLDHRLPGHDGRHLDLPVPAALPAAGEWQHVPPSYILCTFLMLCDTSSLQAAGYPMVTEDNAEPYMGMVQGFLTLDAFKLSLAQTASADIPPDARMSPAYPMVGAGLLCSLLASSNHLTESLLALCADLRRLLRGLRRHLDSGGLRGPRLVVQ